MSAAGLRDDTHPPTPTAHFMSAADFTGWLHGLGLSLAQASEALGVSVHMLKHYAVGTHEIPKTVWLACMHLAAEHARRRAKPDPTPSAQNPAADMPPLRASRASAISRAAGTRPSRSR
ncbi:MAG TPA: hypothetical protein VMU81_02950 [Acetobacteraceae bacterium]|jgi:hypothetical protein|nr:hypothetical protein [Acetobacteraceae bacterium]